jgi:hypothetical protein
MEDIVMSAGISLEQVHHGYGIACWAVNRRALSLSRLVRNVPVLNSLEMSPR